MLAFQARLGRFLVVELESGVHPNRVAAFMHDWCGLAGVVSVTDLAAITPETLASVLAKPVPVVAPTRVVLEPVQEALFE
jgi:hypothetical protein